MHGSGPEPSLKDVGGMTPLHRATRSMMVRFVHRLISANPACVDEVTFMSRSPGGYTALHGMAVAPVPADRPERHLEISDLLIAHMSEDTGKWGGNCTAFGQM